MGSVTSHLNPLRMQRLRSTSSVDSQSIDILDITEDILIHVLSFVPAQDLLKNCCLVCCQWNSLISGHIIWKRKCQRDGKVIPRYVFKNIPQNFYRNIYLNNPYGRNLLKNPDGSEGTRHWIVESRYFRDGDGDDGGWAIEMPPVGADPLPKDAGTQYCFATTYELCEKYQIIDLVKEGINEEILDEVRPKISVGEWHASRFDCGSVYNIKVVLQDANNSEIDSFKFGPFREEQFVGWTKEPMTSLIVKIKQDYESRAWQSIKKLERVRVKVDRFRDQVKFLKDYKKDEFSTHIGEFQTRTWDSGRKFEIEYIFTDYPPGVRYIVFSHSGVDTQWWAGHYGSKMTGGFVKFTWEERP